MMNQNRSLTCAFFLILVVAIFSCKKDQCETPNAGFEIVGLAYSMGDTLQLNNFSENATRYRWEITTNSVPESFFLESASNVCFEASPRLIVNGELSIKLTAANDCYDAVSAISTIGISIPNAWTQKNSYGGLPTGFKSGFSINTSGYMIGSGNSFWEWNQNNNAWVQRPNYPGFATMGMVAFSIGAKGYVGTGGNGNTRYDEFYEWNPATNSWTAKANFGGGPSWNAVAFSIGNNGYIGTGYNGAYNTELWEYDPATDSWLQKNSIPTTGRSGCAAFSIGTHGYIATGYVPSISGNTNELWEWNQLTDVWLQRASLPSTVRNAAVAFAINDSGYVGSGVNNTIALNDFWKYDPTMNAWTQKSDFAGTGRWGSVGFAIGNMGYLSTGGYYSSGWIYFRDLWEFDSQF